MGIVLDMEENRIRGIWEEKIKGEGNMLEVEVGRE